MEKILHGEVFGPDEEIKQNRVKRDFWGTLKRAARSIPFIDDVVAAYFCAVDPKTPTRVRAILIGALTYFVLPIDAIPDFFLALGFSDDVAVLTAAITAVRGYIKPAHREAAQKALKEKLDA